MSIGDHPRGFNLGPELNRMIRETYVVTRVGVVNVTSIKCTITIKSDKHKNTRSNMPIPRSAIRLVNRSGRGRRCISNLNLKPQAYLRPLVDSVSNPEEEFEGVMCLVMDRKEAKNALSVQMVVVGPLIPSTLLLNEGDEQTNG